MMHPSAGMQTTSATDKARIKTAAVVAGVQEDLNSLRQRLTGTTVRPASCQIIACKIVFRCANSNPTVSLMS